MKIISWNVNGIRAVVKRGDWKYFDESKADIFCVQETKAEMSQIPEEVCSPKGYFSYFDHSKGRKGYSGVGLFSKIEPVKVQEGMSVHTHDQEGRLLVAYYEDFALLNVYFPNGGGGPERLKYKLEFYDHFLKFIEKLRKETNVIFCGDVNTAHFPIDLARPKENEKNTGFLPIERAWLDKLVDKGWVDTFRHFNPDKKDAYTYWDQKTFARARNVGWRIDYFFVNEEFLPHVKKVFIHKDILGSDHCPIELDIEI